MMALIWGAAFRVAAGIY